MPKASIVTARRALIVCPKISDAPASRNLCSPGVRGASSHAFSTKFLFCIIGVFEEYYEGGQTRQNATPV
jgi:hypothetical protein